MTTGYQCMDCENYLNGTECEAFPEGIPDAIFSGEFIHNKAYEGDQGIRYQKMIIPDED